MLDRRQTELELTTLSRRRLLKTTGAVVAGAGLADMLLARRAPAQIKGTNLRMLVWSHYVPA